jgi:hypothetical protein
MLQTLNETDVVAICLRESGEPDVAAVRFVLAQAHSAAVSSTGDIVRIYAAALIQQMMNYKPVRSRFQIVGWLCAVRALRQNGFYVRRDFDPSRALLALDDAARKQPLVLQSVLNLVDDALG